MRKLESIAVLDAPSRGLSIQMELRGYFDLTKPRIMVLLLYTGLGGMIVAAHGWPRLSVTLATLFGLALSTGGSAAFNMWYDRDIDQLMKRTQGRPIPSGLVSPERALVFSIVMMAAAVIELGILVNPLTAGLAAAGAFYYSVIYTMWLKRSTPQNIVIGGGAGAFPPLIGAAAATGTVGLPAVFLFLIIFFWTPPHFWSLALYKNDEYRRANIPMMPVVRGARTTKVQCLVYGIVLMATSLAMPWLTPLSWIYLPVAVALNAAFIYSLWENLKEPNDSFVYARRSFFLSILYLFVLFLILALASLV